MDQINMIHRTKFMFQRIVHRSNNNWACVGSQSRPRAQDNDILHQLQVIIQASVIFQMAIRPNLLFCYLQLYPTNNSQARVCPTLLQHQALQPDWFFFLIEIFQDLQRRGCLSQTCSPMVISSSFFKVTYSRQSLAQQYTC